MTPRTPRDFGSRSWHRYPLRSSGDESFSGGKKQFLVGKTIRFQVQETVAFMSKDCLFVLFSMFC